MKKKSHQKNQDPDSLVTLLDSWTRTIIITLLHLTVITVPLFFLFSTNELFEFNKMMLVYVYVTVATVAFGIRASLYGMKLLKPTYLDIPLLVFLVSQLISTLMSIHPYTSLVGYYSRFHGGLLSTISYILLYYITVHTLDRPALKQLWLSSAFAASLVAIYGILERFGFSFSCLMVEGSFGVDCWVQDVQNRVFASFGQPNWLAAYAIMLMPLYASLALITQTSWKKIVFVTTALLLVLVLLFTRSRSGMLGWYMGMGVWIGLTGWWAWLRSRGPEKQRELSQKVFKNPVLHVLFGLSALFVIIADTPYTPRWFNSDQSQLPQQKSIVADTENSAVNRLEVGGTDSGEIRKIVWTGAINSWRRYPWFGSGVETFGYSYYLDRPMEHNLVSEWDFLYNKAHNEFLNFLATTGIVGLLSYLLVLGVFGWFILKDLYSNSKLSSPTAQQHAFSLIGIAGGSTALMVSNFFGFSTVMAAVLLFLYFAAVQLLRTANAPKQNLAQKISVGQWSTIVVVTLLGLLMLRTISNHWTADMDYIESKSLLNAGQLEPGLLKLQSAITKNPSEAQYVDELANRYAQYAVAFAQSGEATQAAVLSQAAIETSSHVLLLNPEQMNFHKTRARVFITLAQLDKQYLEIASETLSAARERAPTDAKLLYNLGVVELAMENRETGITALQEAIDFKPNYQAARWQLATALEEDGEIEAALEQVRYIEDNLAPGDETIRQKIASLSAQLAE